MRQPYPGRWGHVCVAGVTFCALWGWAAIAAGQEVRATDVAPGAVPREWPGKNGESGRGRESGRGETLLPGPMPAAASDAMLRFAEQLIRDQLPPWQQRDDDWGSQKRVYAGFRFRRDGWRLETERRWKEVNHGLWRRYEVQLLDAAPGPQVELEEVYWQRDGRLHLRLRMLAEMRVKARQQRWSLGVRLYSAHVQARVRLQVDLEATAGFAMVPTEVPPALQVMPRVEDARLHMASFEVEEIGHLGGDIAEALGDAAESFVRDEVVEPQSRKLAGKLNRQLEKKPERLRVSLSDWVVDLLSSRQAPE